MDNWMDQQFQGVQPISVMDVPGHMVTYGMHACGHTCKGCLARDALGNVEGYKATLMARGSKQQAGICFSGLVCTMACQQTSHL